MNLKYTKIDPDGYMVSSERNWNFFREGWGMYSEEEGEGRWKERIDG
ncbi:MAG: hypothetical protein ACK5N4_06615 [Parabacteroides gordonii]